jgi:hypothetical protein
MAQNHPTWHSVIRVVVANAMRQTLPHFLLVSSQSNSLAKFIVDRQDQQNMRIFRLAS